MLSFLPATVVERLQYRLLGIEVKFICNTGRDENGAFQFYYLRFVRVTDVVADDVLRERYDTDMVSRIGGWFVIVA